MTSKQAVKLSIALIAVGGIAYACIRARKKKKAKNLAIYIV